MTRLRLLFPLISKRLQTVFSCVTYKAQRMFASVRIHKCLWALCLPNEGKKSEIGVWMIDTLLSEVLTIPASILTYSMENSPSWEANWFSASQEIPLILWNSKVHYRIHKCPPPVPILNQIDPVHTPTFHFLKIHLNLTFRGPCIMIYSYNKSQRDALFLSFTW
jgi:hypothetical protein